MVRARAIAWRRPCAEMRQRARRRAGALAAAIASACGPGIGPGDAIDATTVASSSEAATSDDGTSETQSTSLGTLDSTGGTGVATSSGDTSTGSGVFCWPNPAWAPKVSFSSPTIPPQPLVRLGFTSAAPCTVVGATSNTVSMACPDPRDAALVHAIELSIADAETIDLSGLPVEVALAYHDDGEWESCGDSMLRIADVDGQILLVVAEHLRGSYVEPLQVELVETECTEFAPASQSSGSAECRPGALRFSWRDGELDVPEDTTATLEGGLVVEVIRAGRCRSTRNPEMSVDCGTVHFTIAHPSLLAAG